MATTKSASGPRLAILSVFVILTAFVVYFGFGVADLSVPGAQYDEVADAVPAMELILGQPVSSLSAITVLGHQIPLMMLHHIGPTSIYTSFIGMTIMGISLQALRLTQLMVGALCLVLLWAIARRWFDWLTACIAIILCASAPAFIWWNRAGINWTAPLLPITLAMILLLETWWKNRNPLALIGSAFLLGVGITTKILFVWLIAPIALTGLLCFGVTRLWRSINQLHLLTLLFTFGALLAGLTPLIVHNIQTPLATLKFLTDNVLTTHIYGHDNLDFYGNLIKVVREFLLMIGGDTLAFNAPNGLPLGAIAFILSTVYLAALGVRYRRVIAGSPMPQRAALFDVRGLRLRLFLLICIVLIIPESTVSTSSVGATYLFIVVPLAWLAIAVSIRDGIVFLRQDIVEKRVALISAGVVLALTLNNLGANIEVYTFFQTTGGHGYWSDSINILAHELSSTYSSRQVIAMDWGFSRSVEFLTLRSTHIREAYEYATEPSAQFANVATVLLRDPENIYLFHTPELTAFKGHFKVLSDEAAKSHKQLSLLSTLSERSGLPNTLIYEATEVRREFVVSSTLAARNAVLDGGLSLLGGSVNYNPAKQEVAVILQWQSTTDHQGDDTVLLHIVDQSNGNVVLNGDQQPVYGTYPFTMWQKGEVVLDPHWLKLPTGLRPGIYQVRVGVYDRITGVRRTIADPQNDAAGNSLMLNSFEIK